MDGKRSMNVSIALHQLKMSPKEIVNMLKECRGAELGAEKLRMLLKALPESDEVYLTSILQIYSALETCSIFFLFPICFSHNTLIIRIVDFIV